MVTIPRNIMIALSIIESGRSPLSMPVQTTFIPAVGTLAIRMKPIAHSGLPDKKPTAKAKLIIGKMRSRTVGRALFALLSCHSERAPNLMFTAIAQTIMLVSGSMNGLTDWT